MQTAWADFARDPDSGPGWPRLDAKTSFELQRLGADGSDTGTIVPLVIADYPCAVYQLILAINGY